MHKTALICAVLFVLLFALMAPGFAQDQNGTLRGVVLDKQGAAVPNAQVTATNENTNVSTNTTTSSVGVYEFASLLVGTYTLKVEASGFSTYVRPGIQVVAAQVTNATANLEVGAVSTTIEVSSGANLVQAESSQVSGTFSDRALSEIPVATGANISVLNFVMFLPNTTAPAAGTSGNGGSIGGLRGRSNSFRIDGVDDLDPTTTVASQQVVPDAVQEMVVNQNVYSAEYGRGAGGQFNVITKTGTNQLHFDAWIYNNNRAYNAATNQEIASIANGSSPGKFRYDFNRVGGDIGGPLKKDKVFLYGAYELQNLGQQATAPSALAPTAAGLTTLTGLAVDSQVKSLLAQFPIAPVQTSTILIKTPAAPAGVNVPVGTVIAVAPNYTNQMDYDISGDWKISSPQYLHVRYLAERIRQPSFGGSFPQAQFASFSAADDRRVIINHVWTGSRFVNDFKASYARYSQTFPLTGIAQNYPTLTIDDLNRITIGPNGNLPQHRIFNEYELGDTVSYVVGRHSFKLGGQYFWFTSPSDFLSNSRGQYGYTSDNNGGGGLQQLVNDQFPSKAGSSLQGLGSGFFSGNSKDFSLFVQDDIKVTPRLTLNLGLRYDFFGNPQGAQNNALNSVADLPGTPLIFHVPKNDWNNVGPRVGFAWDPTGSGKWAVRGGGSVAYDVIPWNYYTNSLPIQLQVVLNSRGAACGGTFGPAPAWCASPNGDGFLANGAMNLNFVPLTSQTAARNQTAQIMEDSKAPKVFSWSLEVEREIFKNTSVELRYLGTRGLELPVQLQLNSISAFQNGALPLPTFIHAADIPSSIATTAPTLAQFNALIGVPGAGGRRYAAQGFTLGAITAEAPVGASTYHGGAVQVRHRFDHGLELQGNYTFSKAMDDSTNDLNTSAINPRRPEDSFNLRNEWARSALDVRNKVALTYLYDTPKIDSNNRLVRGTLNGWEWTGSYIFQTGQPITIQSGVDSNGNGDAATDRAILNPSGTEGVGSLVNRVCRTSAASTSVTITANSNSACAANLTVGYVSDGVGGLAAGINPNAKYIQAGVGALTNLGRNTFTSPHTNIWNMALLKNVKATERVALQFRVEAYDVFNHPQYALNQVDIFSHTTNALNQSYANLNASVKAGTFLDSRDLFTSTSRNVVFGVKILY